MSSLSVSSTMGRPSSRPFCGRRRSARPRIRRRRRKWRLLPAAHRPGGRPTGALPAAPQPAAPHAAHRHAHVRDDRLVLLLVHEAGQGGEAAARSTTAGRVQALAAYGAHLPAAVGSAAPLPRCSDRAGSSTIGASQVASCGAPLRPRRTGRPTARQICVLHAAMPEDLPSRLPVSGRRRQRQRAAAQSLTRRSAAPRRRRCGRCTPSSCCRRPRQRPSCCPPA
jgi:hypothetical protein